MYSPADIHDALSHFWGYSSFRPGQEGIIRSVLDGRDTIGLLPTGGGKSVTFQVPALMLPGLTVVVTPLISLMKDQVDNLADRGIRAVCLHSGLTRAESEYACEKCRLGKTKILYVAPERLGSESFMARIRQWDVSLVVVDEAHCISQWGYDFRPSYLGICRLREIFPQAPVLALTASATPEVVKDIALQLRMDAPALFSQSFTRKNITYLVRYSETKDEVLMRVLANTSGPAIVYVRSRKRTRQLAQMLSDAGMPAAFYHAGLPVEEKSLAQDRWRSGEVRTIVATNAFGMGIDKADVRVVVHYDVPSSLEEYYQESGRAGRDGKHSFAVLIASRADKATLSRRLTESFPPKDFILKVYDAACVFLDIPVGGGYNSTYELSPELLSQRFGFPPAQMLSALSILSRCGFFEYADEVRARSRVMITQQRGELYSLNLDPVADEVLQMLLRTYGGLFADYVHIDEVHLANKCLLRPDDIYQALLRLSKAHVLSYIPKSRTPYLFMSMSRQIPERLVIPRAVYEDRKEALKKQIDAMKAYVYGDDCRVSVMLRYFGENPGTDCGTCDVCRARRKPAAGDTDDTEARLDTLLADLPAGTELNVSDILAHFPTRREQVLDIIRSRADRGKYTLAGMTVKI